MKKALRYLLAVFHTVMMDFENLFSNDQAITATASSDNVIDLGNAQGDSSGRCIRVWITETFATLTSLTIALRSDTVETMDTDVRVELQTRAIAAADLVAGEYFDIPLPIEVQRYVDLNYTVGGSNATAGKVKAGIVTGADSTGPHAAGL